MEANLHVGFIGLGTMGGRMAASLQRAGYQLIVNDIRRAATESHLQKGAQWADTPRQVAEAAEVIFTSLPAPPDVEAAALGENGIIYGIRRGGVYFDLSTNSPALVRRICASFAEQGAHMLDAPVSGGPRGAASGRLAIWVGGDRSGFDLYKPVLDAIGDQARYVGPIGSATVAKLVHNCAGYMLQRALSEVFTMGAKAGVDPLALWEAVRQGALGRSRTFDGLAAHFLPAKYDPPDFALRLAHKDVLTVQHRDLMQRRKTVVPGGVLGFSPWQEGFVVAIASHAIAGDESADCDGSSMRVEDRAVMLAITSLVRNQR